MTWRALFARVWLFLRAHLRRQHMCPECGDAMMLVIKHPFGDLWECEACGEEREREALAELTASDPMPYVPQPELNQYEPGTLLWANEVFKDMYTMCLPAFVPAYDKGPLEVSEPNAMPGAGIEPALPARGKGF